MDHNYQSCVLSKGAVATASALPVKRVTFFCIFLATMAVVRCGQCGAELPLEAPLRCFLNNVRMCNGKCMHDAGDRSNCGPWCSCTAYAIKRRMLREHRALMRCMEIVIAEYDLDDELDSLWHHASRGRCSRAICTDLDPELDELSDAEDPEQQLRAELDNCRAEPTDRSAMIAAVQGALECLQAKAADKRAGNDHTAH